jgi:hypothetical protein
VTCTISRNGDLIHRMYLRVLLPDVYLNNSSAYEAFTAGSTNAVGFRWLNWLGHILIKTVEVEIGGQRINTVCPEKYHAPIEICAN